MSLSHSRSPLILFFLQYNILSFTLFFLPLWYYLFYYSRPHNLFDSSLTFNIDCFLILLILPMQWVPWLNGLSTLWPVRPSRYQNARRVRDFSRFLICLVTKGDNVDVSFPLVTNWVISLLLSLRAAKLVMD